MFQSPFFERFFVIILIPENRITLPNEAEILLYLYSINRNLSDRFRIQVYTNSFLQYMLFFTAIIGRRYSSVGLEMKSIGLNKVGYARSTGFP